MARRPAVLSGVALAAAAVLSLSACSGGDAKQRPDAAASPSASQPAAPIELTAANFVDALQTVPASTSYDVAIAVTTADATINETGSAAVQDGKLNMAFTMDVPDQGTLELRQVDGTTYLSMDGVTDGKFARLDANDPDNPFASVFGQLDGQLDPVKSLAGLKDALVSVTKKGDPATIDGVSTQPYEVVVDTTKVTGAAGDLLAEAGTALPKQLTYTYWIGSDNRIRKVVSEVLDTSIEATFTHWGHGTPVVAPTADQITDESPF